MNNESESSYNDFHWYTTGSWDTLEQGDLLLNCPVPIPTKELSGALMRAKEGEAFEFTYEVHYPDLIILTQSCDLRKRDIEQILLCELIPAKDQSQDVKTSVRKEHRPGLHMIEECELNEHNFGQQIVDFKTVFTLPKDFVLAFVGSQQSRVRLLPPYREHLAQAFARYFMRVGLPRNLKP